MRIAEHEIDNETLAMWLAFLRVHMLVSQRLAEALRDGQGLQLTWFDILINLDSSPSQGLRMQELAERVFISQSGLTRAIERMVKSGLVEKRCCEEDRRGFLVASTAKGRAALAAAFPDHWARVNEYFVQYLDDDDKATLQRIFARILDSHDA